MQVSSDHTNGLVQVVADNFDVNISSKNGLKRTHSLAMVMEKFPKDILESFLKGEHVIEAPGRLLEWHMAGRTCSLKQLS